ncbi:MAG: PKD domain-containing protein [Thermoproteota archaeon]|nr:PKD domain-containing protein [Thermoproteota archaeon]
MAIMLTAATMLVIPPAIDLTMTANAQEPSQQQQQQSSNQTTAVESGTPYQNTIDKFKVLVPTGWVIQATNNTGSTLESETQQGYGLLAQLCPQGNKQQGDRSYVNGSTYSGNTANCQGSEGDIIHIVRYPDLNAKVGFTSDDIVRDYNGTAKAILEYQLQKLQEVGYQNIHIVNSTDRTINVDIRTTALEMVGNNNKALPPLAKVPAKLLEVTYSTASAPNEIRTGYILLTATGAVSPNPQIATGYVVFYEDKPTGGVVQTGTTSAPGGLPLAPLPPAVRQVFDSFELMASEETVQAMIAALSAQAGQAQQLGQAHRIVTVHTVRTQVIGGSISPLTGTLSASATSGVAPATFEFDVSIGGGLKPYNIYWDFGDGSQERDKETVAHTFDQAGKYTVTVTVTDSVGQAGSAGIGITVEQPSSLLPGGSNQNGTSLQNDTSLDIPALADKPSLQNDTSLDIPALADKQNADDKPSLQDNSNTDDQSGSHIPALADKQNADDGES